VCVGGGGAKFGNSLESYKNKNKKPCHPLDWQKGPFPPIQRTVQCYFGIYFLKSDYFSKNFI
jgi:hypothetical protein